MESLVLVGIGYTGHSPLLSSRCSETSLQACLESRGEPACEDMITETHSDYKFLESAKDLKSDG